MERDQALRWYASQQPQGDDSQLAVSNRRRALELLRARVENGQAGPVLITGESGSGKTWLAFRLADRLPAGWRSLCVDPAMAMNAVEFLRLIGHALGVTETNRLGAARLVLQDTLQDEATDGRRWLLVVDEAHRGSAAVWDEIQAIVNQLGRPGGFGALVVLGRTELARTLARRSASGFASRLSMHLHLMPLDLDETRELLGYTGRTDSTLERALEEVHRDARGNPGKLFRMVQSRPELWRPRSDRDQRRRTRTQSRPSSAQQSGPDAPLAPVDGGSFADPAASKDGARTARSDAPSLIPTRPPIRDEDGLVEVGWEGDLESDLVPAVGTSSETVGSLADDPSFNEELIEDRYAALQAWAEWTRNQGRSAGENPATQTTPQRWEPAESSVPEGPAGSEPAAGPDGSAAFDPAAAADPVDAASAPAVGPHAGVRAESQHEFAPYSHLFTRLRQPRHPGS